jgi:hypothetical protein
MKPGHLWTITCGVMLSCVVAPDAPAADVEALIAALRSQERKVANVRVTARYDSETWDVGRQEWERSGEAEITAWFAGVPGSKVRIDYHRQIGRWFDGKAPFAETSDRVAYNGRATKYLMMAMGPAGHANPVLEGELYAGRPRGVFDYADFAAGWRFSIFGMFDQFGVRLSDMLARGNSAGSVTIRYDEQAGGGQVVRITLSDPGTERVLVLQPDKGYSLSSAEWRLRSGALLERLTVTELTAVAPNLYYPRKAVRELFRPDGVPRCRSVYEASAISVNDPAWSDSVFDPDWPAGTPVQDRIAGALYVVGMDGQRLEQIIDQQVEWFNRGDAPASQPASQEPAPGEGGSAADHRLGAVGLLSMLFLPAAVAAGAAVWLAQRRGARVPLLLLCGFFSFARGLALRVCCP